MMLVLLIILRCVLGSVLVPDSEPDPTPFAVPFEYDFGMDSPEYVNAWAPVKVHTEPAKRNPEERTITIENGEKVQGDVIPPLKDKEPYEHLWKRNVIPVLMDPTFRNFCINMELFFKVSLTPPAQAVVNEFQAAISHISGRTCLRFKPATDEADVINVVPGNGCWSSVGRVGGVQKIILGNGCGTFGTAVHLLLHSIGLQHEHSRIDRNDFITINWQNVDGSETPNFDLSPFSQIILTPSTPYDYGSIMHYSSHAFSKNSHTTIVPRKIGVSMGQRTSMSLADIAKVKRLYCPHLLTAFFYDTHGMRITPVSHVARPGHRIGGYYDSPNHPGYKWSFDSLDITDPTVGTPVWCWNQAGSGLRTVWTEKADKVINEVYEDGNKSQHWSLMHVDVEENSGIWYLIQNTESGNCMTTPVIRALITTVICDPSDQKQWFKMNQVDTP